MLKYKQFNKPTILNDNQTKATEIMVKATEIPTPSQLDIASLHFMPRQ